ncbi:hypothetical protein ACTOB_000866 [Actinoplanes oblitus]|uniref:Uncharacterized protein n=1 Tax=Actinoplanes oblitus TaxID=3040509 RepID=A0ABY8WHJ7_9ACTN|nr:hypothetical protein [Actinoplanes oblitus]WIM97356.1 hypothetical protein ACTOB_000866 [Actinoplanes oblitus]
MRHLRSILYALVLAPATWVLAGVGFTHDLVSRGRDMFTAESVSGLLLLVMAGILFAIMAFSPISPAGPTLAGAAYLGVTYWAWNAPESYAGAWPPDVVKADFDLSRPGYGLAALLAVPLLCTALSARRWARYEPPVLPIIGEIGRFRGSAKVAGDTVAAIETTVLRTAQPAPSRHPSGDDRTQILRTPVADPTVAIPSAATPAPAKPSVPVTAAAQVKPPAPVAIPTPAKPAVPVTAAAQVKPPAPVATAAPAKPVAAATSAKAAAPSNIAAEAPKTNKSDITANPTIAPEAGKIPAKPSAALPADDDKTIAMPLAATTPADDKTIAIAAPADNDKTTVLPAQPAAGATDKPEQAGDEETAVLSAALVTPPAKQPEVAKLPAGTEG